MEARHSRIAPQRRQLTRSATSLAMRSRGRAPAPGSVRALGVGGKNLGQHNPSEPIRVRHRTQIANLVPALGEPHHSRAQQLWPGMLDEPGVSGIVQSCRQILDDTGLIERLAQ